MKVKRYIVEDMNEAMIKKNTNVQPKINTTIKPNIQAKSLDFNKAEEKYMHSLVSTNYENTHESDKLQSSKLDSNRNSGDSSNFTSLNNSQDILSKAENCSEQNQELAEIKKMVSSLISKVESIEHMVPHVDAKSEDKYIELLNALGIQESISKKIIEILQRQINIHDKNHEAILNAIKVITREYLGEVKTIDTDPKNSPNIYMFLGPTGVGKTTTLAKIAARLSLVDNKKVGLITADTYRIAAVEQLKTYSEILGIPLEVIYEASELQEAIEHFKDKDYILIDTAGRSHKSKELKSDYDEIVSFLDDVKVYLVLSMTTSLKDLKSIIDSYSFLSEYRLLFTKLDEATSYGNILNMKVLTGKSLSYFTVGQSVPDDIEVADKEKILKYIFDQCN